MHLLDHKMRSNESLIIRLLGDGHTDQQNAQQITDTIPSQYILLLSLNGQLNNIQPTAHSHVTSSNNTHNSR